MTLSVFLGIFFLWWFCVLPTCLFFEFSEDIADYIRDKIWEFEQKRKERKENHE